MGNQSLAFYFGEFIIYITPVLFLGGISAMVSKIGLKNGIINHSAMISFVIGIIVLIGNLFIANESSSNLSLKTPIYFLLAIPALLFSISFVVDNASWNKKSDIQTNQNKVILHFKKMFSGRMTRLEYFKQQLAAGFLSMIFFICLDTENEILLIPALICISLAGFLNFHSTIKRLHDFDCRGWYSVLTVIPVINWGVSLFLLLKSGDIGTNTYGTEQSKK
jgi:uncharacterized membrane protein YhaH (DUF805 family)